MDVVLTLHEILHDVKVKKKDGLIFKLDFKKAYDNISWEFLFEMISQRGFDEKWCNWVKIVVSSGTLSVHVNNSIGSYFKSRK
jgi:hypothetical protein